MTITSDNKTIIIIIDAKFLLAFLLHCQTSVEINVYINLSTNLCSNVLCNLLEFDPKTILSLLCMSKSK